MPRKPPQNPTSTTPARSGRRPKFAPVTLSESEGVRYLHFGTEWIQGAMRLRKPDWIELEYAQQMMTWMLFIEQPKRIVQLGLGAAALTKFCRRWYPASAITAVELNPSVIDICHAMFKLPQEDELLSIVEADAMDFVVGGIREKDFTRLVDPQPARSIQLGFGGIRPIPRKSRDSVACNGIDVAEIGRAHV